MLGKEIENAIDDAWARVRREILADPAELHRRLARRRLKCLTRPARAWCIAGSSQNPPGRSQKPRYGSCPRRTRVSQRMVAVWTSTPQRSARR